MWYFYSIRRRKVQKQSYDCNIWKLEGRDVNGWQKLWLGNLGEFCLEKRCVLSNTTRYLSLKLGISQRMQCFSLSGVSSEWKFSLPSFILPAVFINLNLCQSFCSDDLYLLDFREVQGCQDAQDTVNSWLIILILDQYDCQDILFTPSFL